MWIEKLAIQWATWLLNLGCSFVVVVSSIFNLRIISLAFLVAIHIPCRIMTPVISLSLCRALFSILELCKSKINSTVSRKNCGRNSKCFSNQHGSIRIMLFHGRISSNEKLPKGFVRIQNNRQL